MNKPEIKLRPDEKVRVKQNNHYLLLVSETNYLLTLRKFDWKLSYCKWIEIMTLTLIQKEMLKTFICK